MVLDSERFDVFIASLGRCRAEPRFMDAFYERFVGASPRIAAFFDGTDMAAQKRMLASSLHICMLFARNEAAAGRYVRFLADKHAALGIEPGMYGLWLDRLLATVAECDPRADDAVIEAWRRVMTPAVEYMSGRGVQAPGADVPRDADDDGTRVASVMRRTLVSVSMDDTLDAVNAALERHGVHHALVLEHDRLVGVISDRDLLRAASPFAGTAGERERDARAFARRAHQIMSRELVTVRADETIADACDRLLARGISCLPVVDAAGGPIGIVTWRDLLRRLARVL